MNDLLNALQKPALYEKTKTAFWDDEYISKQMLAAHLNPDFEGASRKLPFIEKSVSWISELIPPEEFPTLLDLGCGPGLYGERFALKGYQVTGVDFSKRSIHYAQESAQKNQLSITYLYQNYLELKLNKQFDAATMIYCDYGALSTKDRQILLKTAYEHLKPGGRFLFDVFTMNFYNKFKEQQNWSYMSNGGFWREGRHVEMNRFLKFTENVTLHQAVVITEEEVVPYYLWDTHYTKDSLIKEAEASGFRVCEVFGDIAGSRLTAESDTMSILLEKPAD